MEEEIWKPIEGFDGMYEVSNKGRIKSLSRQAWNGHGIMTLSERILRPGINSRGYECVNLYIKNKRENVLIHKIVAKTFIPNPEGKPCVDHINTIRRDNRVENLRWCTQKENCNNYVTKIKISHSIRGENHPMWGKKGADNPLSRTVAQFTKGGQLVQTYPSALDAAKAMNVQRGSIYKAISGARRYCKGYIWRYGL